MDDIPAKTQKNFQISYGTLCAVLEDYYQKELLHSQVRLEPERSTPGSCTWNIRLDKMGILGAMRVFQQSNSSSAIEFIPRIIVLREEVINSEYGPGVQYFEAEAFRKDLQKAQKISDEYYEQVRDLYRKTLYDTYVEHVEMLLQGIESFLLIKGVVTDASNKNERTSNIPPGKPAGRHAKPGYDAAYEKVKDGLSYSEAFKYWQEEHKDEFDDLVKNGEYSPPFGVFKAAMNYRRRNNR